MDAKTFDELVSRIFRGTSRRDTVRGVLAGAVASAGVPVLAEAKTKNGKGKNHKDKHRKGTTHDEGKGNKDKRQVSAEAKKAFCQCQGTSAAQCTPTTCVDCTFQGPIGRKARKRIRKPFPFSFVIKDASECPGTTTTSTTAAPTTTTSTTTSTTLPPPPVTTTTVAPTTTTTSTTTSTTTTTTTTSTTTTLPPTCPPGRVALSNGTCALPCPGTTPCTGCAGCIDTVTGRYCRGAAGSGELCVTDNDCLQGQFCVVLPRRPNSCTGAC